MQAGLGGCPSCALLRQRTIYPASVTALPNPVLRVAAACSSTGQRGKMWHGANNNGHSRWDRRESFWNKWERRSQQHFWQEVALEEDKRSEAWRSPIKSKVGPCRPCTRCHLPSPAPPVVLWPPPLPRMARWVPTPSTSAVIVGAVAGVCRRQDGSAEHNLA